MSCEQDRSLVMWLVTQERVMRLWIDEVMSSAPEDDDLISRLETHRFWLSRQIEELCSRRTIAA